MALRVVWTAAALKDVESAANYIARDSPRYAAVLVREAISASRSLTTLAKRGRIVPESDDPATRELFVCNHRLIYRAGRDSVHILAFIHGSRDLWALWKRRRA